LAELKKIGDPVFKRKREDEDRPHTFNLLKAALEYYTELANSTVSTPHLKEEKTNLGRRTP